MCTAMQPNTNVLQNVIVSRVLKQFVTILVCGTSNTNTLRFYWTCLIGKTLNFEASFRIYEPARWCHCPFIHPLIFSSVSDTWQIGEQNRAFSERLISLLSRDSCISFHLVWQMRHCYCYFKNCVMIACLNVEDHYCVVPPKPHFSHNNR